MFRFGRPHELLLCIPLSSYISSPDLLLLHPRDAVTLPALLFFYGQLSGQALLFRNSIAGLSQTTMPQTHNMLTHNTFSPSYLTE